MRACCTTAALVVALQQRARVAHVENIRAFGALVGCLCWMRSAPSLRFLVCCCGVVAGESGTVWLRGVTVVAWLVFVRMDNGLC